MKLFSTRFFAAMRFSSSSAAASPSGAGRLMGAARAMERGTTASISAWRDAMPITDSMRRSSSGAMPMWRATNSDGFSSSPSGRVWFWWADISMGSAVLHEHVVGGPVHELIEFGHVGHVDLEEPAFAERIAVGERRVGAQRLVHLDDLAGHRHE